MNPNDPHAKKDPMQAMGDAMADDAWGRAAQRANLFNGDADHDSLLWREHYYAKYHGGRDPLEGHPEAIRELMAEANQMDQSAVPGAQDTANQDLQNAGLV